ncbi:MAG: hypothetical protein ABSC08_10280 [Bryobacteraceae bacterium]|jgi:hypothetical protein
MPQTPTPDPAARRRFYQALSAYGVLAVLAWTTLDGGLRWLVLILLAAFALKSWVHLRRIELE